MTFPKKYKCLDTNHFQKDDFSIVPIRYEDRLSIMQWRNEQIYHLRQATPLTTEDQEHYFQKIISQLFEQKQPNQLLFSFLKEDKCIGYGGLVHINWIDKNGEISFIMETASEKEHFSEYWLKYLCLIEQVAFEELNLHKIYTYAFDVRPHLYEVIEKSGFEKEAVLKEHCFFEEKFIDVVIHSKIKNDIHIRLAKNRDVNVVFEWVNDETTRKNSFNSEKILFENHEKWWQDKMKLKTYFIIEVNNQPAGIVRFDRENNSFTVGINISPDFRGKKLASTFLTKACKKFRKQYSEPIFAYIKPENIASKKSFFNANFQFIENTIINQQKAEKHLYA